MGFLTRLFQSTKRSIREETPEQRVMRMYRSLPPASAVLLVAGPGFGEDDYVGDVLVDSHALRPWAQEQAEGSYVSDPELQAALEALPIWLRSANQRDETPTKVHPAIAQNLRAYIPDFFKMGIAKIHCPQCNGLVADMVQEKHNENSSPVRIDVTHEWYCLKGHLLRRVRSHTHLVRRKAVEPHLER